MERSATAGQRLMYVPEPYLETRADVLLDAVAAAAFGTLITATGGRIRVSHVPFAVASGGERPVLVSHLSRANPQAADLDADGEAVATWIVDHAYISPSWYPSKQSSGRVVPTWNYVAVEARGRLEAVDDPAGLRAILEAVTDAQERGRPEPWAVADAPAAYTDALLRGITGLRFQVEALQGAWKLDQRKPPADRLGAADGLALTARTARLAERMRTAGVD